MAFQPGVAADALRAQLNAKPVREIEIMSGEKHLGTLLSALSPEMMDGEFVFCSFENSEYGDHSCLDPIAAIKEFEGLTLVISKAIADEHGVAYESVLKGITLNVHSSLDAVGLTATFASRLAEYGISANVIAGFFHDHVFVQTEVAEKAMTALRELSSSQ